MVGEDEPQSLRRALRDLVALTILPAIWADYEPHNIGRSLADVLLTTLVLDVIYIRLNQPGQAVPLELVRTQQRFLTEEEAQTLGQSFTPWLNKETSNLSFSIPDPLLDNGVLQIAVMPLGHDAASGFIVVGNRSLNPMTEQDRLLLKVAANQGVTALRQANLLKDLRITNQLKDRLLLKEQAARIEAEAARAAAEDAQRRMRFLAEASAVLAASLDYETALTFVIRLAVPTLADWASIVLLEEGGGVRRVYTIAKTQHLQGIIDQLQAHIPLDMKGPSEIVDVLKSGKSLLIPQIHTSMLEHYALDSEHLDLMRQLNPQSTLIVALQARGNTLGAISFNVSQEGRQYDADDLAMVEGLAHRIAMAIDRARLYQDQRRVHETLQTRVQLQAIISELGQQALTSDDVSTLLDNAAVLLVQTLGVEYSKILELQPQKNRLFLKAGVGWREGLVGKAMINAGLQSQAGYTLLANQPIIVEDLHTETRFQGPRLLLEHKVVSGVSVIIQGHERPWGVLGIHSAHARTFTQDDIYFVQSVANILGAALERARWYDEAQKTTALQERQRIARELHDAVSQTLFAANLLAESLPRLWEREPDKAFARIRQLHQLTRGAAAEMRVLLIELRPESVINADLSYLLTQLGYAMPGRQNMDVSVLVRGWTEQSLPPDAQVAFYRIAQESLNNIIKHGQAKQARIRLIRTNTQILLSITDNGRGFDMQRAGAGLGLKSMWERANSIGAMFQVRSKVGWGTRIKLVWTIPQAVEGPM